LCFHKLILLDKTNYISLLFLVKGWENKKGRLGESPLQTHYCFNVRYFTRCGVKSFQIFPSLSLHDRTSGGTITLAAFFSIQECQRSSSLTEERLPLSG
jgi:hypothetical protein